MNSNRSKIFSSLRKKIVNIYPEFKKNYKEFQEEANQQQALERNKEEEEEIE